MEIVPTEKVDVIFKRNLPSNDFEIEEEGTLIPKEIIMTEKAGKDVLVEISRICKKLTRCCDYNN